MTNEVLVCQFELKVKELTSHVTNGNEQWVAEAQNLAASQLSE